MYLFPRHAQGSKGINYFSRRYPMGSGALLPAELTEGAVAYLSQPLPGEAESTYWLTHDGIWRNGFETPASRPTFDNLAELDAAYPVSRIVRSFENPTVLWTRPVDQPAAPEPARTFPSGQAPTAPTERAFVLRVTLTPTGALQSLALWTGTDWNPLTI